MSAIPSRWVVTENPISLAPDVFPSLAGQGFPEKTPTWNTNVQSTATGREVRTTYWSGPRWKFKVSYEVLRNRVNLGELSTIWGFFATARGKYGAWFYLDPYDNYAESAALGVGNGTTTDFQPTRTLAAGTGYAFSEPVYAFWLAPTVYVNGSPTSAFTVQPWGVIRFNTPPSNGSVLTWTGNFLYVCRFDQDDLTTVQMTKDLFSASGVQFLSLKP